MALYLTLSLFRLCCFSRRVSPGAEKLVTNRIFISKQFMRKVVT